MNLPRLALRSCRLPPIPPSLSRSAHSTVSSSDSTAKDNLELFRKINELASKGKWDSINNAPPLFRFGNKEAYDAFYKLVPPDAGFFRRTPYGQYLNVIAKMILSFTAIWAAVKAYESFVPEQYRLHYKYREKHEEHKEPHH